MSVDLSKTIAAKSDQLNADDLVSGPITVRVRAVRSGSTAEQPITMDIDGWPQPYKPCKTMRRVLVAAWGSDGDSYVGRSLTLYRDPTVTWAGDAVGGIRISAMSNIPHKLEIPLALSKKSKKKFVIEVLTDHMAEWSAKMANATDSAELSQIGVALREQKLSPADTAALRAIYQRRSAELKDSVEPDANEMPAANDIYQGLQQRIRTCKSGTDASVIKVDIASAIERHDVTAEEGAELHEMLRREMA